MTIDSLKRTTWNFFSPTQLTFGPGAVGTLAALIGRRSAKRVLLVTDEVLQEAGVVSQVEAAISQTSADFETFAGGEVEPSTGVVDKLVDIAKAYGPDLIVAVGGGSNMDLAKACVASLGSGQSAESMFGFDNVPAPCSTRPSPALVCLPTTSGTGSEMTHSAILKSSDSGKKAAILSQYIRPDIAIVDPRLALTCPAKVTAESGIDALTHAIEAYLVTNFYAFHDDVEHGLPYEGNHPLGDMYAEKAISLVGKSLQRAVEEPENLAARSGMSFAATLAGAAFSSCGVSLAHALEYPIGSTYKCSHGAGNGIVLPEVMRYWLPARKSRLAKIAAMLKVPSAREMPEAEAAEASIEAVESLRKSIALPTCLRDVGGQPDDVNALATSAMSLGRLLDLSPVTTTIDDVRTMLSACM